MSALRLRVRGPGGGAVLHGVRSDWSLQQLKSLIESELQVPAAQQGLRAGFPPALIPDAATSTLAELGINDGDTMVVEDRGPQAAAPGPSPTAAVPAAAALRAANSTTPPPSSADTDAPSVQQLCAMGFSAAEATGALAAAGGDVGAAVQILLGGGSPQAARGSSVAPAASSAAASAAHQRSRAYMAQGVVVAGAGGCLHRRVVPADNSCLFNSVGYVCHGDRNLSSAARLRKLVADAVLADPVQYSDAILGKPTHAYAEWICGSDHWGGAIELSILCQHYKTVISCVCIQTLRVDHYGEGNGWPNRAMLIYDGLHYDALALEADGLLQAVPSLPDRQAMDVTSFEVGNSAVPSPRSTYATDVLEAAVALAREAQAARQFTDTSQFALRCLVCQKGLVGQEDAVKHATETGHQNFSEY